MLAILATTYRPENLPCTFRSRPPDNFDIGIESRQSFWPSFSYLRVLRQKGSNQRMFTLDPFNHSHLLDGKRKQDSEVQRNRGLHTANGGGCSSLYAMRVCMPACLPLDSSGEGQVIRALWLQTLGTLDLPRPPWWDSTP